MALHVPKAEIPTELGEGMIKQFGAVPKPVEVMWHNPKLATLTAVQWSRRSRAKLSPTPLCSEGKNCGSQLRELSRP